MTLTSLPFLIFVCSSLVVYYIVPRKFRWIVLLIASFTFYGIVCFQYFPFILFTILTTYGAAVWEEKLQERRSAVVKSHKEDWDSSFKKKYKKQTSTYKRLLLAGVLVLNFAILFLLKGYIQMFFPEAAFSKALDSLGIILPLGISFYTFQSMGYIIDVYRGKTKAEKNPARLALFVSFFPQIIQGPISIYDDLAAQLYDGHELKFENIKYGFELVLWGLVKKFVIADRAVVLLNQLVKYGEILPALYTLCALLIYALQLYADFSGGIDMIRGIAEMFGINMAENFRRPYFSRSLGEYWRRWHITLGRWLKDYLFYPIAMSGPFFRLGKKAKKVFGAHIGKELPGCIATLITFVVIGIWHGANWKYVGFGLWNGLILFASGMLKPVFAKTNEGLHINTESVPWRVWQMFRTFLLVLAGYAFDIADGLKDALNMIYTASIGVISDLIHGSFAAFEPLRNFLVASDKFSNEVAERIVNYNYTWETIFKFTGFDYGDLIVIILGVGVIFTVSLIQEKTKKSLRVSIDEKKPSLEWTLVVLATVTIILMGCYGSGITAGEFVYMNF